VAEGKDGIVAASKRWKSGKFDGEDKDLGHQLVLGGVLPVEELFAVLPGAGEDGEGWETSEASRFGRYARRLWCGLLAAERLEDR